MSLETLSYLAVLGLVSLSCNNDPGQAAAATPAAGQRGPAPVSTASVPAPASTPVEQPQRTLEQDYAAALTLQDALDLSMVQMADTTNEDSLGTIYLTRWAADRMKLASVAVAKNETSFKLVMKDSDSELGKRLCVRGRLISISKVKRGPEQPTIFAGLLNTGSFDIVSFFAVQSTGELVEGNRARLCGVVTGRYSYSNAGGGSTHAIKVVGVFDIKENVFDAMEEIADRACTCTDLVCANLVRDSFNALAHGSVRSQRVSKAESARLSAAAVRARACLAALK
jgi:hypothetical protein